MNVSYKGIKKELSLQQKEKLQVKFAKISKLLEKRGEREAHVVVTSQNHLHKAEISMVFHGHPLVSICSDTDVFTALHAALDKLEKQAVKNCEKYRAKARRSANGAKEADKVDDKAEVVGVVASSEKAKIPQKIFRVNHLDERKPMTIEEAVLEMGKKNDYVVFRDDNERVSVLIRRKDGHFDLVEA
jgi:putative sigma-54 modulation protein